ncbi:MAG: hypothetical protein Q8T11_14305 [Elusimicrobiota bacterium]|nr:hypothetical protein [Elusimicrobiota bacterium]
MKATIDASGLIFPAVLLFALSALALAPRASAGESRDGCLFAYNADYALNWLLLRSAWETKCGEGLQSRDIIRAHQTVFIEACLQKFLPGTKKAGFTESDLRAYCSRGTAGEALLSSRTGISIEAPMVSSAAAASAVAPVETNAWTRIYALTRLKGNRVNNYAFAKGQDFWELQATQMIVRVPKHPGVEADTRASDICRVESGYCDRCQGLPGYDHKGYMLVFDDVGCRGTLESIRWSAASGETSPQTRAWLNAKMFARAGEKYEEELVWYFRNRTAN